MHQIYNIINLRLASEPISRSCSSSIHSRLIYDYLRQASGNESCYPYGDAISRSCSSSARSRLIYDYLRQASDNESSTPTGTLSLAVALRAPAHDSYIITFGKPQAMNHLPLRGRYLSQLLFERPLATHI